MKTHFFPFKIPVSSAKIQKMPARRRSSSKKRTPSKKLSVQGRSVKVSNKGLRANAKAKLFVLGLPISAFLVLYILLQLPSLTSDGQTAGITGIVTMAIVVAGIYKTMQHHGYKTNLLNVFLAVCTFTAAIDLGISGFLLGVWNLGSFYPEHGEKYFASSFGVACLTWDGVAHLLMQSYLCYQVITNQKMNKQVALVWSGSIINSMMPLLMGTAATGKYSSGVELSTAMNAPYILVPIIITYNLMSASPTTTTTTNVTSIVMSNGAVVVVETEVSPNVIIAANGMISYKKDSNTPDNQSRTTVSTHDLNDPTTSTLMGSILVVTHIAFILLHVVRTMAVLNSDAKVAKTWLAMEPVLEQQDQTNVMLIQCIQSFFYLIPYHCLSVWEIFNRAYYNKSSVFESIGDWSFLVLGAYLQSTFIAWFMTVATYKEAGTVVYSSFDCTTTWIAVLIVVVILFQAYPFHKYISNLSDKLYINKTL